MQKGFGFRVHPPTPLPGDPLLQRLQRVTGRVVEWGFAGWLRQAFSDTPSWLTLRNRRRYGALMPIGNTGTALIVLLVGLFGLASPGIGSTPQPSEEPRSIPPEEYPIYNLVITSKFLTSRTQLVVIRNLTATRLGPFTDDPPSREFLVANEFFGRPLAPDLISDFVQKMGRPSRLERALTLGVPYQLIREGEGEDRRAFLAPIPTRRTQGPQEDGPPVVVGLLELSRVGFNLRENEALVYVGIDRPDGTGAGFLIWLHRTGRTWSIADTEVLWTARP